MDFYNKKYGIDSEEPKVKKFHSQRRMFAIKESVLHIGLENAPYTHAKWFEKLGWITPENDEPMNYLVRGFVDTVGVYFYKDYDFDFDIESEKEVLQYLEELAERLNIDMGLHLFGGLIKGKPGDKWPGKKDYGRLGDLIKE